MSILSLLGENLQSPMRISSSLEEIESRKNGSKEVFQDTWCCVLCCLLLWLGLLKTLLLLIA